VPPGAGWIASRICPDLISDRHSRALTDEEIIKVWHASGKLGAFGLLM
jgi:hypothetical protein